MTMNTNDIKTYEDLKELDSFESRYEYLKLGDKVGDETFGHSRILNQTFYTSDAWRKVRDEVIIRDNGCDLGIASRPIGGKILVHHLNAITKEDIINRSPSLLDPNNLVCVSKKTHDAIHFGSKEVLYKNPIERKPGDTKLW